MSLSRRDLLKMGALGSAAVALPIEQLAFTSSGREPLDEDRLPRPFSVPFSEPPVAQPVCRTADTDYYKLRMLKRRVEILPGYRTEVWAYEGTYPGPTIEAVKDRRVVARFVNRIGDPRHEHTSVHLHGHPSRPQFDGYASDVTEPGQYKDYKWENEESARTLWYHDHGVHVTARNTYMGLAGFYLARDPAEASIPIPQGRYDVPLLLRDALFARDGSLIFDDDGHDSLFGHVILVNGRPWPRMRVERRKYLFRVLNGATSRAFKISLSSGEPLTVVATDSGLMPAPQQADSMRIGNAERYGVVIDFAKYQIGQQVVLRNGELDNNREFENTDVIMRFDVVSDATDTSNNEVPPVLNPNDPTMALQESQAVRTRTFEYERQGGEWTINDKTWRDVIRSGFRATLADPGLNDVEIWKLENGSGGWFHPVHLHLVDFKILDRNGRPPLDYERGPKDTAYVGENETVRVIARFGPHRGKYMMHCHNVVHEDHDMMHQFEVGQGGRDPLSKPARDAPGPPLC
jgi:spore coat protein A, manganese oxidase